MSKPFFTRKPLATGVAIALGMSTATTAVAQDQDSEEGVLEEVVVLAIRQSLETAQSLKEQADTFVDGITAQDIGALPDRSVAEALQRLPGVNIGRYQKSSDPDRVSVEGVDVLIRGLPFVRSELNGRDVFSATGGTVLSFNDVSPELMGSVLVYKNSTADMIEGGIAGTVDLRTRKPLDTDGPRVAGSVEMNYSDLAEESSPTFSFLGSNNWETKGGRFGLQLGYANSELNYATNVSQVTDPCYRDASLETGCYRVVPPLSQGDDPAFTPDNFPPPNSVIVPKGAGVRTTEYERDREAFSLVGQWESNDGDLLVTAEYLRADAELFVDEHAILALVNDDALFPSPAIGTDWTFNNGTFASGVLSQNAWRGIDNCQPGNPVPGVGSILPVEGNPRPCNVMLGVPTEMLRFQRQDESTTEDISLDITWNPTDDMEVTFEAQHVKSERSEDGIIGVMQMYSEIFLDMQGTTPDIQFRVPITTDGSTDPNYFTNRDRTYYSFLLDSQLQNDADMSTLRADLDYYFSDDGFFRKVKFGARWSDRNRVTRNTNFNNWGVLSAPWSGFTSATYASEPTGDIASYSNVFNPFGDFQRGNASVPVPDGAAIFYGGDNFLQEYFAGTTEQQANAIHAINPFADWGQSWRPVYTRDGATPEFPFLPGEISDVDEQTQAAYFRLDFGIDTAMPISGNFGLRYVKTTIGADGQVQMPIQPPNPEFCNPDLTPPGGTPGFCFLSDERLAEFEQAFTGELIVDDADIDYTHWLPSLNVRLDASDTLLFRGAISKGISRPDLASYQTGGLIFDNTNTLRDEGTLETGPLFAISTGNRLLEPVEAWNYDLSVEWYFQDVGSLTFSMFYKDFEKLITRGATIRTFVADSGAFAETEVRGPANVDTASMKGFEFAYQQTFDMLPGIFSGLGAQFTYTYVDASDLENPTDSTARSPFADGLPLAGVSEDTINAVIFWETEAVSARLAYNWRSEFLITPRDDIFPFSPIYGESTGQLDGSVFWRFHDNWQVGLMGVNLLDEVVETSSVIDFDGTRIIRSAYRSDRRYTLALRYYF